MDIQQIQQLFKDRLPHHPYCSDDFQYGVVVRAKAKALEFRHIQPNSTHETAWLIFDLDYAGAACAWEDAGLPVPTIIVTNSANGHAHLFYGFETPIYTSKHARSKPIWLAQRLKEAIREKLKADSGYSGLMAKNPFHPDWSPCTQWTPKLYDLKELVEYVTITKPRFKKQSESDTSSLGRNCTLLNWLNRWGCREVMAFKRERKSYEQWHQHVLSQTEISNTEKFPHNPLPYSEVKSLAKSVAKWVWKHYPSQQFSNWQSARGKRGGRRKTTTKNGKPWEALGISRATWYRRRKTGQLDRKASET